MRCIVVDTNVFVSGIFWAGAPYQILNAWRQKEIQIVYSREILEEYIRVGHILEKKPALAKRNLHTNSIPKKPRFPD
jgi:putative PIN family toxin of toxin-antitoxin system